MRAFTNYIEDHPHIAVVALIGLGVALGHYGLFVEVLALAGFAISAAISVLAWKRFIHSGPDSLKAIPLASIAIVAGMSAAWQLAYVLRSLVGGLGWAISQLDTATTGVFSSLIALMAALSPYITARYILPPGWQMRQEMVLMRLLAVSKRIALGNLIFESLADPPRTLNAIQRRQVKGRVWESLFWCLLGWIAAFWLTTATVYALLGWQPERLAWSMGVAVTAGMGLYRLSHRMVRLYCLVWREQGIKDYSPLDQLLIT